MSAPVDELSETRRELKAILAELAICPNPVLDEDGERVCECGDEGRMCESCAAAEAAWWKAQFRKAPLSERDPETYEEQMRDAGRGHLLPPS